MFITVDDSRYLVSINRAEWLLECCTYVRTYKNDKGDWVSTYRHNRHNRNGAVYTDTHKIWFGVWG